MGYFENIRNWRADDEKAGRLSASIDDVEVAAAALLDTDFYDANTGTNVGRAHEHVSVGEEGTRVTSLVLDNGDVAATAEEREEINNGRRTVHTEVVLARQYLSEEAFATTDPDLQGLSDSAYVVDREYNDDGSVSDIMVNGREKHIGYHEDGRVMLTDERTPNSFFYNMEDRVITVYDYDELRQERFTYYDNGTADTYGFTYERNDTFPHHTIDGAVSSTRTLAYGDAPVGSELETSLLCEVLEDYYGSSGKIFINNDLQHTTFRFDGVINHFEKTGDTRNKGITISDRKTVYDKKLRSYSSVSREYDAFRHLTSKTSYKETEKDGEQKTDYVEHTYAYREGKRIEIKTDETVTKGDNEREWHKQETETTCTYDENAALVEKTVNLNERRYSPHTEYKGNVFRIEKEENDYYRCSVTTAKFTVDENGQSKEAGSCENVDRLEVGLNETAVTESFSNGNLVRQKVTIVNRTDNKVLCDTELEYHKNGEVIRREYEEGVMQTLNDSSLVSETRIDPEQLEEGFTVGNVVPIAPDDHITGPVGESIREGTLHKQYHYDREGNETGFRYSVYDKNGNCLFYEEFEKLDNGAYNAALYEGNGRFIGLTRVDQFGSVVEKKILPTSLEENQIEAQLICETKYARVFITDGPYTAASYDNPQTGREFAATATYNTRDSSVMVSFANNQGLNEQLGRKLWGSEAHVDGRVIMSPPNEKKSLHELVKAVDIIEKLTEPINSVSRAEEVISIHDMTNKAVISAVKDRGLEIDTHLLSRAIDQRARD